MINKGKRGVEIINKIMQYFLKDISHQIERAHRVPKITDENKHISEDKDQFSLVQSLRSVQLFATPWTAACQASLSITDSWSLLESIESVMPSSHLILYRPLLLPPSISSSIRVFLNESALRTRWPKYWGFSFNISPSNEYSQLIFFRMDWLDILAVQDSQESSPTPQFKSIRYSALSFLYSPTLTSIHDYWKNHSLD